MILFKKVAKWLIPLCVLCVLSLVALVMYYHISGRELPFSVPSMETDTALYADTTDGESAQDN